MAQQINTLLNVWPHISEDGVFICEDTHTSYWEWFGGGLKGDSMIEFSKGLIDLIHREHINAMPPEPLLVKFYDLKTIHFYNSQIVFLKGRTDFKRHIVND